MDDLQIEALLDELTPLAGCAVSKIHQPAGDLILLRLWDGRTGRRLLLALGNRPRVHLTERTFANPFQPPGFCRLLRARVRRLTGFTRAGRERILRIDATGPKGEVRLYCELFGATGNLVLTDGDDRIVDALRRQGKDTGRSLLPGRTYRLPETRATTSLFERLPEIPVSCRAAESFRNWLTTAIWPMSGDQAEALAEDVAAGRCAQQVLSDFRRQLLAREFHPVRMQIAGRERIIVLPPAGTRDRAACQLSQLLDEPDSSRGKTGPVDNVRRTIGQVLRRQEKKLRRRLLRIENERQEQQRHDQLRRRGELLLAQLHLVKKGMSSVQLVDYYRQPPGPVDIPLDPALSPQQNAERCFRQARKFQRGLEHSSRRRRETLNELHWIEEMQMHLARAGTPAELAEIRSELLAEGLLPASCREPASRRRPSGRPPLGLAHTPSGFLLQWGRSSRGNDFLTTRLAAPHDYWFHAREIPGCHLVLRRDGPGIEVPRADLEYAAAVAAGWSRAAGDASVEVICALVRDVGKPRHARPGQVVIRRFSTLRVAPLRLPADPATHEND